MKRRFEFPPCLTRLRPQTIAPTSHSSSGPQRKLLAREVRADMLYCELTSIARDSVYRDLGIIIMDYKRRREGTWKAGGWSNCNGETRVCPPVIFVVVGRRGVTPLPPSMMVASRIRVRGRVGLGQAAFTRSATRGGRGIDLWQRNGLRSRGLLCLLRRGRWPPRLGSCQRGRRRSTRLGR